MDPISKRRRHIEKVGVRGHEDRISNLPEGLIGHILSFLPTQKAVATSVLSTKWKYIWTSITTLDFDMDGLVNLPKKISFFDDDGLVNLRRNTSKKISFTNFVYRVLARNVSDLQKFHLNSTIEYDASHHNAWVSIALSRNLRELHLEWVSSLPRDLFTSRSLVVLKVMGTFVLSVPTSVCLPNLKILTISYLQLDDDSIYRLFSSCPVLEDLFVEQCDLRNISVLNISVPSLKSLTIKGQTWYNHSIDEGKISSDEYDWKHKIVINTPNLQNLRYKDYVAEGYSLNKLDALVKAHISLVPRDFRVDDQSIQKLAIAEFVERMSKVQWLQFPGYSIETFQLCRPKFDSLTYLKIGGDFYGVGWKLLLYFVESSPRLDTLIFGGLEQEEHQTTSCLYQPQNVPPCLLFHLKKIQINWFQGNSGELEMAEYFLKNSRVLEKLTICAFRSEELEVRKKVLILPRSSKTCQVEVLAPRKRLA